jgi:hypothetical protein
MRVLYRVKLLLGFITLLSIPSFAQDDVDQFLTESVEDGRKLISAYVSPFMKSVSLGMNQGWYNTAKTHKIAGVDLTITVNAMSIPTSELFYNVPSLGLTKLELAPSSPDYAKGNAPTIFGTDREPVFRIKDPGSSNFGQTFEGPPGLDLKKNIGSNRIPVPMAHLGFGLPKNTDIKIRFTPTIDLGDEGSLKIFGIGVMHDIKQWIPGIKLMPFDLSGFVGYTKFNLETKLDADNPQNADQKGVFNISATTVQALISKKFSVITFYGGLGYNIAKSNLALKGKFDINDDGDENDQFETNPVDLKFAASGPRVTAGMRLKLAVFTFHADYTLQKYKCLTVGFGIAVR